MSYYTDYIQGLCPESESWVVEQICGELDCRDDEIKELKRREEILVAAMSEIKVTNEGKSEQPIADIVAGCISELRGSRDEEIKALQEVKNAAEFFFGRSRCFEAVEQFRAECC